MILALHLHSSARAAAHYDTTRRGRTRGACAASSSTPLSTDRLLSNSLPECYERRRPLALHSSLFLTGAQSALLLSCSPPVLSFFCRCCCLLLFARICPICRRRKVGADASCIKELHCSNHFSNSQSNAVKKDVSNSERWRQKRTTERPQASEAQPKSAARDRQANERERGKGKKKKRAA